MAVFSAFILRNEANQLAHKTILLVRRGVGGAGPVIPTEKLEALQQHVWERYHQSLTPLDIDVVDADDLKARIKKLNKGR